jgi:hypothetical protein
MAKRCENLVGPVVFDSAQDITRFARSAIQAFHESEVAVCGCAQQGMKIGLGMVGYCHSNLLNGKKPGLRRAKGSECW